MAKLVDFGIAVLTSSETYTRLTATGMVLGTPAYMPPEQVCGDDLDARSDVYSLAATLHTILVGEPPYGRGTWGEILPRILTGSRTRLETRGLDRPLASVIEQGLAVDREARWGSAREMELALSALDVAGQRTVLEWQPPPQISALHLGPFDNTGPGFAKTLESQRPGPFPSTREQPSSNPPPPAAPRAEPSHLAGPDPVIDAVPEAELRVPMRGGLWPLFALGAVGSLLAAGLVFWVLTDVEGTQAEAPATPADVAAPAEETPATEARDEVASGGGDIPEGVEAPAEVASEEETLPAEEEVRARSLSARRTTSSRRAGTEGVATAETTLDDDEEWKAEEEGATPMASTGPTSPPAETETNRRPAIMVNVVGSGGSSVTAVAPGTDPSLVPMVTYRTHR